MGDKPNSSVTDANLFGDSIYSLPLRKAFANVMHGGLVYCSAVMRFALRILMAFVQPATAATLAYHIVSVVFGGAQKQVGGIDTRWIVALVEYPQVIRNRAVVENPTEAMRVVPLALKPRATVAGTQLVALPNPALVRRANGYVIPKRFLRGVIDSMAVLGNVPGWFAVDPAAIRPALFSDRGLLAASATAISVSVGPFIRGIMGLHENLHFSCQAWDAANVARHFSLGTSLVSIPHFVNASKAIQYKCDCGAKC